MFLVAIEVEGQELTVHDLRYFAEELIEEGHEPARRQDGGCVIRGLRPRKQPHRDGADRLGHPAEERGERPPMTPEQLDTGFIRAYRETFGLKSIWHRTSAARHAVKLRQGIAHELPEVHRRQRHLELRG